MSIAIRYTTTTMSHGKVSRAVAQAEVSGRSASDARIASALRGMIP